MAPALGDGVHDVGPQLLAQLPQLRHVEVLEVHGEVHGVCGAVQQGIVGVGVQGREGRAGWRPPAPPRRTQQRRGRALHVPRADFLGGQAAIPFVVGRERVGAACLGLCGEHPAAALPAMTARLCAHASSAQRRERCRRGTGKHLARLAHPPPAGTRALLLLLLPDGPATGVRGAACGCVACAHAGREGVRWCAAAKRSSCAARGTRTHPARAQQALCGRQHGCGQQQMQWRALLLTNNGQRADLSSSHSHCRPSDAAQDVPAAAGAACVPGCCPPPPPPCQQHRRPLPALRPAPAAPPRQAQPAAVPCRDEDAGAREGGQQQQCAGAHLIGARASMPARRPALHACLPCMPACLAHTPARHPCHATAARTRAHARTQLEEEGSDAPARQEDQKLAALARQQLRTQSDTNLIQVRKWGQGQAGRRPERPGRCRQAKEHAAPCTRCRHPPTQGALEEAQLIAWPTAKKVGTLATGGRHWHAPRRLGAAGACTRAHHTALPHVGCRAMPSHMPAAPPLAPHRPFWTPF